LVKDGKFPYTRSPFANEGTKSKKPDHPLKSNNEGFLATDEMLLVTVEDALATAEMLLVTHEEPLATAEMSLGTIEMPLASCHSHFIIQPRCFPSRFTHFLPPKRRIIRQLWHSGNALNRWDQHEPSFFQTTTACISLRRLARNIAGRFWL